MNKSEYNAALAAGSIIAGGTLGILISPCIMLVVMGPILEVPIVLIKRFLRGITGLRSNTKQKSKNHGCGTQ